MTYGESNGHVIDDVTWLRNVKSWPIQKRGYNRFFENMMEPAWGERRIDDVGDEDRSTFFRSEVRIGCESDCWLGQLNRVLECWKFRIQMQAYKI